MDEDAYSQATNEVRLLPLHTAMLEIIYRLENDFDLERTEGYGLDEELERDMNLARPDVRLTPTAPEAAPIVVAFSTFPGLRVRFGRWYIEHFQGCARDACDESVEGEIERLNNMVDDVISGRFREVIMIPAESHGGSGWREARLWSTDETESSTRTRSTSRVDGGHARETTGDRDRMELNWRPWPRRCRRHCSHQKSSIK